MIRGFRLRSSSYAGQAAAIKKMMGRVVQSGPLFFKGMFICMSDISKDLKRNDILI